MPIQALKCSKHYFSQSLVITFSLASITGFLVSTIIASFGTARSSTELFSGSSTELIPRSFVPTLPITGLCVYVSLVSGLISFDQEDSSLHLPKLYLSCPKNSVVRSSLFFSRSIIVHLIQAAFFSFCLSFWFLNFYLL